MNERIKELVAETDIWCDQNIAQRSPAYNNLWEQKFAELIIRECADRIRFCIKNDIDFIAEDIEKHFGVENE